MQKTQNKQKIAPHTEGQRGHDFMMVLQNWLFGVRKNMKQNRILKKINDLQIGTAE